MLGMASGSWIYQWLINCFQDSQPIQNNVKAFYTVNLHNNLYVVEISQKGLRRMGYTSWTPHKNWVNSKGQFNAPFGRYKNPTIADETVLRTVSAYLNLANVRIAQTDFATTVADADQNDFIYFDPPYDPVSTTASFTSYDRSGFDRTEQQRLKSVVDQLSARGCKVLLSNAHTEFIQDLYQDYKQVRVRASRAINSKATKRGKVDEILVMNYWCLS